MFGLYVNIDKDNSRIIMTLSGRWYISGPAKIRNLHILVYGIYSANSGSSSNVFS